MIETDATFVLKLIYWELTRANQEGTGSDPQVSVYTGHIRWLPLIFHIKIHFSVNFNIYIFIFRQ